MSSDEMQQKQTQIRLITDAPAALTAGQQKLIRAKAEAVTRLSHPAIVPVQEVGFNEQGAPYVVTELIDEPTLADVLKTEQLDESTVLDYAIQICEAVSAAHIGGVAHGNLTAENIYVCDVDGLGNQIRVANFGIPGTTNGRASFQNDVEALGRLMSKALQGRRPRTEFENVILFCLEDNEDERYRDCREVLQNLLLVRQGKLPEPPKHRPGQKFVTPQVVVIGVIAAILITVGAFISLQSKQSVSAPLGADGPSALQASGPSKQSASAPSGADGPSALQASGPSALQSEQARAKYGLSELDRRAQSIDRRAKLKHAADKAVEYKDKAKSLWRKFRE
jgi:serine/threonine protein kinase